MISDQCIHRFDSNQITSHFQLHKSIFKYFSGTFHQEICQYITFQVPCVVLSDFFFHWIRTITFPVVIFLKHLWLVTGRAPSIQEKHLQIMHFHANQREDFCMNIQLSRNWVEIWVIHFNIGWKRDFIFQSICDVLNCHLQLSSCLFIGAAYEYFEDWKCHEEWGY